MVALAMKLLLLHLMIAIVMRGYIKSERSPGDLQRSAVLNSLTVLLRIILLLESSYLYASY